MKGVAVLGATGSIGRATLDVIRRHTDRFRVVVLTAGTNAAGLDRAAREFEPDFVALAGDRDPAFTSEWEGEWRFGPDSVADAAGAGGVEVVVNGLVGVAGLEPTLRALHGGRRVALANKESLVAGGELVLEAARASGGELIPVDSEHSAIHQCLAGRPAREVRRVILTASGGPFRATPVAEFGEIGPEDALAHPTWEMGRKITIDSATLANKALEVIEAHHLFGLPYDRIDVVVHPQSIVHSLVEFRDGSVLAQLGSPTMEIPILHALAHPDRPEDDVHAFDPIGAGSLTFEPIRRADFPMFGLGLEAGRAGGAAPAVYNAANEVAVEAFLDDRLAFTAIPEVVEGALEAVAPREIERLADVWSADREARERARDLIPASG